MDPTRVLIVDDTEMFIEVPKFVLSTAAEAHFWIEMPPTASSRRFVWP